MQLKKCNGICQEEKNISLFHKKKDGKFGVKSICKECVKKLNSENYILNKDVILNNSKKYIKNNKQKVKDNHKRYNDNNKQDIEIYQKKYYQKNKEDINKRNTITYNNRLKIDPLFKMKVYLRNLIRCSFKNKFIRKNSKTANILGCTFEEFKDYLENKFTPEMNWQNQGSYWHMDHIKPISLAKTEQEIIDLNHYTNFQPLEKFENLTKSNKYKI